MTSITLNLTMWHKCSIRHGRDSEEGGTEDARSSIAEFSSCITNASTREGISGTALVLLADNLTRQEVTIQRLLQRYGYLALISAVSFTCLGINIVTAGVRLILVTTLQMTYNGLNRHAWSSTAGITIARSPRMSNAFQRPIAALVLPNRLLSPNLHLDRKATPTKDCLLHSHTASLLPAKEARALKIRQSIHSVQRKFRRPKKGCPQRRYAWLLHESCKSNG